MMMKALKLARLLDIMGVRLVTTAVPAQESLLPTGTGSHSEVVQVKVL